MTVALDMGLKSGGELDSESLAATMAERKRILLNATVSNVRVSQEGQHATYFRQCP